jgi:uncharacterized protein YdeI (YjbR/CyaY-like superfamily)
METHKNTNAFYAKDRTIWRTWLLKNHQKEKSVWLIIYHKTSSTPSVYYEEAVEEALCFGWIDSVPNKRDHESSYLFLSVRKPKSNWSKANRDRAEKMINQKLMMPAGQAMIDFAKKTGTWTALEGVQNLVIPEDLQIFFYKNKLAFKNFNAFPPSSRRGILEWILNAKRPETRLKRIKETVELAKKNIKANH